MIENIDQSKLQEVINAVVGQNASIGVHGISTSDESKEEKDPKNVLVSIMSEGLRMSTRHTGLTGTIRFLDLEDCAYDIIGHAAYQTEDENGIIYRVICALPEVMEDKNGEKYYLGKYDNVRQLGKDNIKVQTLPTHDLSSLPKEFIVGFLAQNVDTGKATFVLNKNYYNIQDEEKKRNIEDTFLQNLKSDKNSNMNLLPLNEDGYEKATKICEIYSKIGQEPINEYYLKSFIEKYNEQGKVK